MFFFINMMRLNVLQCLTCTKREVLLLWHKCAMPITFFFFFYLLIYLFMFFFFLFLTECATTSLWLANPRAHNDGDLKIAVDHVKAGESMNKVVRDENSSSNLPGPCDWCRRRNMLNKRTNDCFAAREGAVRCSTYGCFKGVRTYIWWSRVVYLSEIIFGKGRPRFATIQGQRARCRVGEYLC